MWYALVTLCSVGYGDIVPKTLPGQLVGFVVALGSVLATAFPVPVIVTNFTNLYMHMRARNKLPKERRRVLQLHELHKPMPSNGNPTFKTIRSPTTLEALMEPQL
jgi:hypothetical protein